MTKANSRLALLAKIEGYICSEITPELMEAVNDTAERFEKWGKAAAAGKCVAAFNGTFKTVADIAFAGDQETAAAMAEFMKACYMAGSESGVFDLEAGQETSLQEDIA